MPELILYQRGEPLLTFPVRSATTQIGRSPECDITLAGETISRIQCTLYEYEGSYLLKNVGKATCLINGKPCETLSLKNGDRISLEGWEIVFMEGGAPEWSNDETYVSKTGGDGTKMIHSSLTEGMFHAEKIVLSVRESQKEPRTFALTQEVTTIGKNPNCDLVLSDPLCSDTHCKLIIKGNGIVLFDLHSTNGTTINGVRVREADLEEGSKITLGKTEITVTLESEDHKIEPMDADSFGPIIGKSKKMRELYDLIQQVAPTDATVCILGETGSGKELVARSLHDLSPRHLKSWVALNCGAISRELIESELFGHEKGAFTGAHQQRAGAFEQANGGTLFLDEVGELPLELQPALLRVLETGRLRRVGGNQEISVNVRVVCATHRNLAYSVTQGKFREDLFFRLYVFPIYLPALRERREDILLIANHFLKIMSPHGKTFSLSVEAARYLEAQEWRGNVRELKNIIQRAVVLTRGGEIKLEQVQLPRSNTSTEPTLTLNLSETSNLEKIEKEMILRELRANDGNRKATAKALGIAKSTLYEKLKLYQI